ncbi:hypothetical protein [Cellulomonas cellasea]|uniref:DUF4913 domain-containing protein n=1 Tax=Cellulomonas cellasea DSM 20118 TaxID=1408250 RepID=A0A0A0BDK4_9CELL|nr:hypothetical protein [Cellulomonas cellasea]KGM03401.1 hypothetical protein Q760_03985 [Cellulomonas cellasea DSM 20118]
MNRRPARSQPVVDAFFPQAELPQPFGPAVPICWAAHGPDDQRLLLEDLDTWVTWLTHHYSLDRRHIPECWTEHWEFVEELAALHLAWEGAFSTTAHADAPLGWHERFHLSRTRLTEWVARTGCRPGEHRTSG